MKLNKSNRLFDFYKTKIQYFRKSYLIVTILI